MRDFRLKSLEIFESKPMPQWGGDIAIDFQDIYYYLKPTDHQGKTWDDVPEEIKDTFDRLGIPEAEKKFLAGVKAQYESEVVYGSLQEELANQGVIFTDTDSAVREHPDLVREYFAHHHSAARQQVRRAEFGRLVGRVVHLRAQGREDRVPAAGLLPHQRREHGPVRADADHRRRRGRGALRRRLHRPDVHAPRACTRPSSKSSSSKHARCRYTTIQNWANNIYNLVTKRAMAYERLADGMGRRQPRQPADDEVSGRLHDGAGRPRRDPVDRLRLGRPAPGRRRQAGALRPEHLGPDHLEVDLQERRPGQLSRAGQGREGRQEVEVATWSATP